MGPKVLHLVEYLYQGGIERFLSEIGRTIPDVHLKQVFFAYEMYEFKGAANDLKKAKKDVRIFKKCLGYDFKLLHKLNCIIKEENIEILHTHDFGPMEYAVALKLLHPRLILIHTQHTLHHFIPNIKYVLFFQLASYFYSNIVAVSGHVKEIISKRCLLMKGRPTIIYNGVDKDRYSTMKSSNQRDSKLNLLSISRISKEKNLQYTLETCKLLRDNKIDFHLHHAGTGAQKEVDPILHYIENNGLSENITLYGYQQDIREVLKYGDIFISSSFTEGHPIAVLEAMASFKICLCSNIPAHNRISPNGIILFNLEDKRSLYNTLINIKERRIDCMKKINSAKKDIDSKYSLQKMISHYLDIYTSPKHQLSAAAEA